MASTTNTSTSTSTSIIKTDDKKQHFDDIYIAFNPVPYKIQILDALEYISDNFNQQMFDAHILPFALETATTRPIQFVDLCSCFGNTTMATIYGMNYQQICTNWQNDESCEIIQGQRRFDCHVTAIDISQSAMEYGKRVGLYDTTYICDLNNRSCEIFSNVCQAMNHADILLSTAALVYLDLETIDQLIHEFSKGEKPGFVLVNFLNPFALEKADQTKRILLQYLEFVGSRATRHRRLSPLEQANYPGEQWSLLELWVLKRRTT